MGFTRVPVLWEHKFHAKRSLKQACNLLMCFSNSQSKWIRKRTICCFPPPLNFKFICVFSNTQYFSDDFITHRGFKTRLHQAAWWKVLQMSDSLKFEQLKYHFCHVLNTLGLNFPNKMKWDLWNTRRVTGNRDETFELINYFYFGDSVCNTCICFHKLYKLSHMHRIFP